MSEVEKTKVIDRVTEIEKTLVVILEALKQIDEAFEEEYGESSVKSGEYYGIRF